MEIEILRTGLMDTNSYVLYGEKGNECIVIDPADAAPVLAFMEEKGLSCTHILLTHGHFDHTTGVAALKEKSGAKVGIGKADAAALLDGSGEGKIYAMWGRRITPCAVDLPLEHEDRLEAAGFQLRVLATPGHTPGGLCFLVDMPERIMLAGDTLFRGSVGRFDLPGGDGTLLLDSIRGRLFTLEADYKVFPGHGPATTLDYERGHNAFVRAGAGL